MSNVTGGNHILYNASFRPHYYGMAEFIEGAEIKQECKSFVNSNDISQPLTNIESIKDDNNEYGKADLQMTDIKKRDSV